MTARTLFSDSQPQLVARVLNNLLEDKLLSANTFLSMTEPVRCLSDDGHKPASLMVDGNRPQRDTLLFGESALPVSSSSLSSQMSAGETELHASSVSTAIDEAMASGSSTSSSEGQQDHIESLLQRLPDKLPLNQKSSPNSVLGVCELALPREGRIRHATAVASIPIGHKIWNSERLCSGWRSRELYNSCRFVSAAMNTNACQALCVARADPKTIGPLSHPTGGRCCRLARLMLSDDLDTSDMPDTPYQGTEVVAAGA